MSQFQIIATLVVFAAVILVIAFDFLDMLLAAALGACTLYLIGAIDRRDLSDAMSVAAGPLALLLGGMIVARALAMTGVFDAMGVLYLRLTRGSGKRFLIYLVAVVAPVCAVLPNATTVILLAPVIVSVARSLKVQIAGPLIVTAIVSNSAGMLTLVGDPATFLVGSSIGITFVDYLKKISLVGLLAVLVVIPLMPRLMPDVWNARIDLPPPGPLPPIHRPKFAAFAFAVLAMMIALFLFGEDLPVHLAPPGVSIVAASLALLAIYSTQIETVDNVFKDVDWKTLVFLAAIFCLVQAFTKTGLLQGLAFKLEALFDANFVAVALALLFGIGGLSAFLANIPVVAASLVMTKGYLIAVQAVPDLALSPGFKDWPVATIPLFVAMMCGATLGGNATMIGAAANIVSIGIAAREGERVTFGKFMRYGLPITAAQLGLSGLYVVAMLYLI